MWMMDMWFIWIGTTLLHTLCTAVYLSMLIRRVCIVVGGGGEGGNF